MDHHSLLQISSNNRPIKIMSYSKQCKAVKPHMVKYLGIVSLQFLVACIGSTWKCHIPFLRRDLSRKCLSEPPFPYKADGKVDCTQHYYAGPQRLRDWYLHHAIHVVRRHDIKCTFHVWVLTGHTDIVSFNTCCATLLVAGRGQKEQNSFMQC